MKNTRVFFSVLVLLMAIPLSGIAKAAITSEICLEASGNGDALLIVSVPGQSVYERVGLREGDRITGIDFVPVGKMTFSQAVSAVHEADIPGNSVILSVHGSEGTRMIHVYSPAPDHLQEAFLVTEREILEAWEASPGGWKQFIEAARSFTLGQISSQDLSSALRLSRSILTESRNRLISVEIPSLLPSSVRSNLWRSKNRLAEANMIRSFAAGILYGSLVSGKNQVPTDEDGGTVIPYLSVEKKGDIAAGEGLGYLIKAKAGMALR